MGVHDAMDPSFSGETLSESLKTLLSSLKQHLSEYIKSLTAAHGEITLEIQRENLLSVAEILRQHPSFQFEQLIDVCGVDYLDYGLSEWSTYSSTTTGFERGVQPPSEKIQVHALDRGRFAVAYHFLSISLNHRLRLKIFLDEDPPYVDSLTALWPSASWFEREAFDLFGILFKGHEDLRRILTDYGFIGHPFRKDFPLIGTVEMRYDKAHGRVVYEPVSIKPRTLVPKVIRQDYRREASSTSGDPHV